MSRAEQGWNSTDIRLLNGNKRLPTDGVGTSEIFSVGRFFFFGMATDFIQKESI